jgi:hypothetical protein
MRKIPQLASRVTEAFTAGNEAGLSKAGLPVTPATTYLAHFAGLGGAIKVLQADPNTPVAQILGNAALKANPFLQGMTARDLELWAARKMQGPAMVAQNAQAPQGGATPQQVASAAPGNLPPSANAGSPAPQINQPPAQPAPIGAGAPAPQQPAQPQLQQPPQQAQQPRPQPQQPLVPQEPLPQGYTDPMQYVRDLRAAADRLSGNQHPGAKEQAARLDAKANRIEESLKPISVGPSTTLLDPRTANPVFQGASLYGATASGPTLDADAERYRQTGTLPPNMGRGVQGELQSRQIRARAAELEIQNGGDPAQWPTKWQDYRAEGIGKSAGARTKANREENLNLILKAADAAIPAALEASKALPRGDFVPLNKLIQKGEVMTSNPKLLEFGMANLQLAEHWARAMNPTGVMRESDRDKALHFLDVAYGNNTYERAVMQLQKQITRERDAVRGGSSILKDGKSPDPSADLSAKADNDGWVTAPNGARIREKAN